MYDFFLSYNKAEKEWVRDLALALTERRVRYFFDEEIIGLGDNVPRTISDALKTSKHVVAILSPAAVNSHWAELEWASSLYEDTDASDRKIIPILRKNCEIPLLLRRIQYLDAQGLSPIDVADRLSAVLAKNSESGSVGLPKVVGLSRLNLTGPQVIMPLPGGSRQYVRRPADSRVERIVARGGSTIVFGPRGVGKTSLLLQIKEWALAHNVVCIFVDNQGHEASTGEEAWTYVAYHLADSFEQRWKRDKAIPIQVQVSRLIRSISRGERLILLMDELDGLLRISDALSTDILRTLVGIDRNLSVVAASHNPFRYKMHNVHVSPWYTMFSFCDLTAFSLDEIDQYTRQFGLALDRDSLLRIDSLTCGDPMPLAAVVTAMLDGRGLDAIVSNLHHSQWEILHYTRMTIDALRGQLGENWAATIWMLLRGEPLSDEVRRTLWFAGVIRHAQDNPPVCSELFQRIAAEILVAGGHPAG